MASGSRRDMSDDLRRRRRYIDISDEIEDIVEGPESRVEKINRLTRLNQEVTRMSHERDATYKADNMNEYLQEVTLSNAIATHSLQIMVAIDSCSDYSDEELFVKLNAFYRHDDDDDFDNAALEDLAMDLMQSLPNYLTLGNALTYVPIEVAVPATPRARAERTIQNAATVAPSQLNTVDEQGMDSVEKTVKQMLDAVKHFCRANTSISYYKFLFETDDFAKTVENAFHFSFLVRDMHVAIDKDENGLPMICLNNPGARHGSEGTQEKAQAIMSINHQNWQIICARLNIRRSMFTEFMEQNGASTSQQSLF